jgi:uncharacterized protein (DUF2252 family)
MSSAHANTPIVHLDPEERAAIGRAARTAMRRSSHASWEPPADRRNPVDLLTEQEVTRVEELVPVRHERMLVSPFTFYRGAAVIMAADLGSQPDSGLRVQACGDAHLANFGGFASPERAMQFDINDFDETNPGPFEWDVKRLVTSFEIAARSNSFSEKEKRRVVNTAARYYREAMVQFSTMTNLNVWYAHLDVEKVFNEARAQATPEEIKRFEKTLAKAQSKDSMKALTKLTEVVDGEHRIKSDPPLIVALSDIFSGKDEADLRAWLADRLRIYRRSLQPDRRHLLESYRMVDFARKVVGVGSVGTRCFIALMLGRDDADPLVLQIKEAEASVLEPYAGRSSFANHGQRVVEGQRMLQASSDIMLGWIRTGGADGVERDYYVRQLWDWKFSADIDAMSPSTMEVYARLCGWTLARGHARSGDRIAIAAYLGSGESFDRAIAEFAVAYADQNERDYAAVAEALGNAGGAPGARS